MCVVRPRGCLISRARFSFSWDEIGHRDSPDLAPLDDDWHILVGYKVLAGLVAVVAWLRVDHPLMIPENGSPR